MAQVTQETTIMLDSVYQRTNSIDTSNSKASSANLVLMPTQQDAQSQAYADAATCGARVFLCHIYEQGKRNHLAFSLPFNLLLEMAKLQSADNKRHKSNAEELINRPLIHQHVDEIAKYLLETDNYILPPFIFNSSKPIKVFAFGTGAVKFGYAVLPTNVELYVTDGQHRLKAIEKAIKEKSELRDDSVTVLVVQEEDIDQIHQDFADCAKNKPIPPALLAAFDVSNVLSKLTRQISRDLVIFNGRIDKISKTLGKDPNYIFTMNQLRIGMAEFLFGSSRKQVIESRSNQQKGEDKMLLEKAKVFYMEFAKINDGWQLLLQPVSKTVNLDLYSLRQDKINFNTVGLQILSRVGNRIFFGTNFSDAERNILIDALASLDYRRTSQLWQNSVVIDDGDGNKRIVAQIAAVDKGCKIALREVEQKTGIKLS
ncbi:DNA sulfur modification protein DndB [Limnofasciculus baicalensis]|uniref:DNA sulfur modification protein DndB n=1 Tax=Limnofasciculus baicalensis BBK-W-15 TaxID=2699891 RepID=A0AAE3GMW7_9CYAN|nr:DNA sulfur modification protein DndB [Limnofasciculus baicalensis]MCP2727540.1 DNA sulfur modification protein DndB [Limnofasciculus baicalensis BBK-W-15]